MYEVISMENNKIVHFEFDTDNVDETVHFYAHIFGWKFKKWDGPMEYWMIEGGPENEMGINGGLVKRDPSSMPTMINVINVDDIDEKIEMIKDHKGEIITEKTAVQGIGWIAYFKDTQGNVFGMMQTDMEAK